MARRRQIPFAATFAALVLLVLAPLAGAQVEAPSETSLPSSSSRPGPTATFSSVGGVSADGAEDSGAVPYGAPAPRRPIARVFAASPSTIKTGDAVRLRVRIDEPGVKRVSARVVILGEGGRVGARFSLGRVRTHRVHTIRRKLALDPGAYLVRLHVKDPDGETLARAASTSGKANLVVKERPRPRPENSQPEPPADTNPPAPRGGTFPVAGTYSFAGADGRFGAGRPGRSHEGQDISASDGTPVVAPVAGTVTFVDYQGGGAGYYIVLAGDDQRSYFFAHLKKGSTTVQPGQRVAEATAIAGVGSTGASSGPHLHFEIWVGGWRDKKGGSPIDPLPQLREWER